MSFKMVLSCVVLKRFCWFSDKSFIFMVSDAITLGYTYQRTSILDSCIFPAVSECRIKGTSQVPSVFAVQVERYDCISDEKFAVLLFVWLNSPSNCQSLFPFVETSRYGFDILVETECNLIKGG